ncbi:degenerin deg-1-like [Paramuricea clavata]|uniref:Degenerin deg-1-like n=1 Tax=Paramuricea clavata TaxID=317549 RepID=A0A7D9KY56_PARCT|nr:degenerin deg-1-like [Paramuricea clavata]
MFWKWSWNYRYGNCYTFNDGVDNDDQPLRILKSSKPGPSQGLVLHLDIEENEYLGELTEQAGVRVLLHEPGVTPFPYEEGFSVAPGMATSVGLTKTLIKRLDRFEDGSCSEEGVPLREENLFANMFNTESDIVRCPTACLNSCLGKSQLAKCDCAEVSYPSIIVPCNLSEWKIIGKCLKNVKSLFSKDKLPCIDECKRPCREEIYEKTISSSQWPSPAREKYESRQSYGSTNRSNGLLLNIFYSQLNYQVIEETFSYRTTNLLADIGGQLGLWIGLSALTCSEVLQLIFNLLALAYMKFKNRRQNRVVEIGQPTE